RPGSSRCPDLSCCRCPRSFTGSREELFMIIGLLVAAAVTLFFASLPLGGTVVGATLKKWALFAFLLALIPSMCFDMTRLALRNHPAWTPGTVALEVLMVLVVSAIAFVALAVRKMMAAARKNPRSGSARSSP